MDDAFQVDDDSTFFATVEEIYELACRAGEALAPPSEHDFEEKDGRARALAFFAACYQGFQAAQERILTALLGVEDAQRESTRQLKEFRRTRNNDSARLAQSASRALADRELILRNLANAIAWQVIGFDVQLAQTLFTAGQPAGPVSGTHHESAVIFSRDFRRKHPHGFALINDLTTLVHAADSFTVQRSASSLRFGVVELKTGEKNFEIGEFAHFAVRSKMACPASFAYFAEEHGEKGIEQLLRNLGQYVAMSRTAQRITSPPVRDMQFGTVKKGSDVPYLFGSYDHCLSDCLEAAVRTSKPSVARYDGCLYVSASVSNDLDSVLAKTSASESSIDRDVWQSFREPLAIPVFVRRITRPSIMQLTFGAVNAKVRLDLRAFEELGRARGLDAEWLSRRQTAELSPRISVENAVKGRALAFGRDGRRFVVGDGLVTRIFFHGLTPEAAIDIVEASLASDCQ